MKITCAAVGLAGLLLAGTAHAGLQPGNPIYSSFTTGVPDSNGVGTDGYSVSSINRPGSPLAQEFNVTTTRTLTSLWLRLSVPGVSDGPPDNGSILVYLVPDKAGSPSNAPPSTTLAPKTLLGTIFDSSIFGQHASGCAFGPSANIDACNTYLPVSQTVFPGEYWIALVDGADTANGGTNTSVSDAFWWRAGDTVGLGTGGQNNAHVNASGQLLTQTPTNITQDFELQVNVPEPAGMAMLGVGLLGLGFVRRRNKKSAG